MTEVLELLGKIILRCKSENDKPNVGDQDFEDLERISNTLSEIEMSKMKEMLLLDHICDQLWEDCYPSSPLNEGHSRDIGESTLRVIFSRYRPSQIEIVEKMYSPHPGARLFSIWFSTYEVISVEKGIDYDQMAKLLVDVHAGVGNRAITELPMVVSPESFYEQIVVFFQNRDLEDETNTETAGWLLSWIKEVFDSIIRSETEDPDEIAERVEEILYEDHDVQSGSTWARTVMMLREDEKFHRIFHTFNQKYRIEPFQCSCGTYCGRIGVKLFSYDVSCGTCRQYFCSLCLSENKICKNCVEQS
tara:strand:- start:140 stop:1051 length:912 start_codon:yes stop_codon:yes gene_type:complete